MDNECKELEEGEKTRGASRSKVLVALVKEPGLGSQNPHSRSQPPVMPFPGAPMPSPISADVGYILVHTQAENYLYIKHF